MCRPMSENRECPSFLGIHIAERALSLFFDGIERMPFGNPGFDFICGRGYKIDVKSACRCYKHGKSHAESWSFHIKHNTKADYFLCLAFDNRVSLTPEHVWLIPAESVKHLGMLSITNNSKSIAKWKELERPIDRVISCCEKIKGVD